MAKQKLEQYLRNTLKDKPALWFIKLQNSHFQPTPADFIVLTENKRYLIECKQIKFDNMRSSLSFDRMTQLDELVKFKLHNPLNESLILIMFWNKRLKNSYVYLIPINDFLSLQDELYKVGTKSVNVDYLDQFGKRYKIEVVNGLLDINLI